jgi:hypothetical protein
MSHGLRRAGTFGAFGRFLRRRNLEVLPMLRTAGLVGGLVLLTAAAAPTQAPPALQKAFTGTIVSTYPDGRQARLWMNRSGDYTSMGRRHDRHHGRWSVKGDKVCFHRGIFGYCTAIPTNTAFTTHAVTGETIQVRLVPGRAGESGG